MLGLGLKYNSPNQKHLIELSVAIISRIRDGLVLKFEQTLELLESD